MSMIFGVYNPVKALLKCPLSKPQGLSTDHAKIVRETAGASGGEKIKLDAD